RGCHRARRVRGRRRASRLGVPSARGRGGRRGERSEPSARGAPAGRSRPWEWRIRSLIHPFVCHVGVVSRYIAICKAGGCQLAPKGTRGEGGTNWEGSFQFRSRGGVTGELLVGCGLEGAAVGGAGGGAG